MIQLILGEKGNGKTKLLLDKVNSEVKSAHGNVVYLDKNTKHMYELNNKIRLINVSDFGITSSEAFIGFIYGIISQDHDLEQMYLDSFLKIAQVEDGVLNTLLEKLDAIGEKFALTFVISISVNSDAVGDKFKDRIVAEL